MLNGQLKSYVEAMAKASSIITEENPDFLVAPMCGSIPFIDVMYLVDRDFDPTIVVYMPASSKIANVNHVIDTWYSNFLNEIVKHPDIFPKVMGIDEVVSGQSVVRCFNAVDKVNQKKRKGIRQSLIERLHSQDLSKSLGAITETDILTDNNFSYELNEMMERIKNGEYKNKEKAVKDSHFFKEILTNCLNTKLKYKTVGIEDSKVDNKCRVYKKLIEDGIVIPVKVLSIITMDNPKYCPVQLEPLESTRKNCVQFSPKVKEVTITPEYMEFLSNIAKMVGRDPSKVHPINLNTILQSSKYLN